MKKGPAMKIKVALATGVALVALAFPTPRVEARTAPSPYGVWYGRFSDGSGSFSLVIRSDGSGGFAIANRRGRLLRGATGYWSHLPNSTGGVLTLHYRHVGFHNKIYFGFSWRKDGSIVLTDYYTAIGRVSVVLRSQ
jgi:hypothetical protein